MVCNPQKTYGIIKPYINYEQRKEMIKMKTNKKIAIILVITTLLILLPTLKVQAGYQSIGNEEIAMQAFESWMTGIRQMEGSGQGLGLSETINTSTLLSNGASNNIDVHLQKNTEYGAVVLLGASDYGKQGSTKTDRYMNTGATTGNEVQASTTGNKYGVYEIGYYEKLTTKYNIPEYTTGMLNSVFRSIAPRYKNEYTASESSALAGDATTETKYWHSTGFAEWVITKYPVFLRGNGSAFAYHYEDISKKLSGRAAIVVGTGL